MIPVTYPSSLSYKTTRQMVAFPIADITGKRRWTDYIPVKFVNQTTFTIENAHNNNAYVAVDVLSSITNLKEGIDYIPIYIDDAATDAWQVSATGYIPVGYSGASLSLQFAGATTLDSRITFTRASSARYFNNQGVLTSAGNNVARFDHDPVTKLPRGLLIEEQRTNLLLRSEEFDNAAWTKTRASITANTAVAPDGALTGDKLVEDTTASNNHQAFQSLTVTNGVTYTFSVYAKAGERTQIALNLSSGAGAFSAASQIVVNLSDGSTVSGTGSVTAVGNGWYRITVQNTAIATAAADCIYRIAVAGSTTYTGDGTSGIFLWGAQLEAGAFSTSYIPTVAAQVTRSADSASMTGTNFSSWYRADEGTLFAEFVIGQDSDGSRFFANIDDGGNTNAVDITSGNIATVRGVISSGGAQQAVMTSNASAIGSVCKGAVAYRVNDFAFSANGAAAVTDTAGNIPVSPNRLSIGSYNGGAGNFSNTAIRRIAFYPARLANAQLQALTN